MKNKKSVFVGGLISISLILVGLFVYINFFFGKYLKEVTLASNLEITADSKEIDIRNLVKVEREINYISILLEPSYKAITESGQGRIKVPGGEIINPEIKVVDEAGKEYALTYGGSRYSGNNEYVNYRYQTNLPLDVKYEKVLIRSEVPIKTQEIIWTSFNARDLP